MNIDKQIDIDLSVEEMASAVRERTVACNKCEYYKEGSCLKPIDFGCDDNEDILNLCDAIYDKGYRKASEVVRDIFNDLNEMWHNGRGFINYSDLVRLERLHEQKYTEVRNND